MRLVYVFSADDTNVVAHITSEHLMVRASNAVAAFVQAMGDGAQGWRFEWDDEPNVVRVLLTPPAPADAFDLAADAWNRELRHRGLKVTLESVEP